MHRNARALTLLAAVLLVGTALVPAASLAQEEAPEDEAPDEDDERETERKIEVDTEGHDIEITFERETEPRKDEVKMSWKAEEATFELEHESENATRELEQKLEATFGALAEYRDDNGNGRYDPGETLVSGYTLGDDVDEDDLELSEPGEASWGTPDVTDTTRDGKDGKKITSTAEIGNGTLTLRFLVFGDFVELNGTSVSPTGAKIDIIVDSYSFQANDTDLALFLETKTENEFEQEIDDDEETGVAASSQVNGTEVRMVFTWKDSATVDGASHPVGTTVLEEETESETEDGESSSEQKRSFALSYARGDRIVHDPKAEVQTAAASSAVPGPGALAALVTLGVLALAHRRRVGQG